MSDEKATLFRALPQISAVLDSVEGAGLAADFGEGLTKLELRRLLEELRSEIKKGKLTSVPAIPALVNSLHTRLQRFAEPIGRAAINATGILLHTGLGRAPLSERTLEAIHLERYSIVQVEIESGGRSVREHKIEAMLRELTGCEAVTVVNNNAAATFLALHEMGCGGEMIISRGQLIEIGGSFRMPDVMERSGTVLREVGTTNRTHLKDYEQAINENTKAILHVHPSNYAVRGFSGTPSIAELGELSRGRGVPLIADLGSGAIVGLREYGLKDVTTIGQALKDGAVLTCSSGDKLICGPQAGILCGNKDVIQRIRKNPFSRMFRVDKCTLAGLEATLVSYINGNYREEIPLYRQLSTPMEDLERRAASCASALNDISGIACGTTIDQAYVGGGSLPDEAVESYVLELSFRVRKRRTSPERSVLNSDDIFLRSFAG